MISCVRTFSDRFEAMMITLRHYPLLLPLIVTFFGLECLAKHAWLCPRLDLSFGQAKLLARKFFYGAFKESCLHGAPDTDARIFCKDQTFCVTEMAYEPIVDVAEGWYKTSLL